MNSLRELCTSRACWQPGRFVPIAIVDIDLAQPRTELPRGLVHALVRLGGTPIGEVLLDSRSAEDAATAVLRAIASHEPRIARALARRALAEGNSSGAGSIDALLEPEDEPPRAGPLVTVAVCSRDRPAGLRGTLEALRAQEYPSIDVLVVDNAPRDDSAARVVRDMGQARHVIEPSPGLDRARSRAVREARGEILAFIDDDARPSPSWVTALVRAFTEAPEATAVTGLVLPESLATPAQLLFESYGGFSRGFVRKWWHVPDRTRPLTTMPLKNTGRFGTGTNMAFRTAFLRDTGGFDPALDVGTPAMGGGDLEIFFRVVREGRALLYEPAAIVRHEHRADYDALLQQLEQWGSGMAAFIASARRRYPDEHGAFARFDAYMLGAWFLRRLATSFVRPAFPREMILTELRGRDRGADRYLEGLGRLEPGEHVPGGGGSPRAGPELEPVRQYVVDLSRPLSPLPDAERHRRVAVEVRRGERRLGHVTIENGGQPVGIGRLRDEVVRLDPYAVLGVSADELRRALMQRARVDHPPVAPVARR